MGLSLAVVQPKQREPLKNPPLRYSAALLLVIAVTILSYLPSLRYGFVSDDTYQIVNNPTIQSWGAVPGYFVHPAWTSSEPETAEASFRPLFLLWLRINNALFALQPLGWHLMSVLVHLGVTLFVFALLRRHLRDIWLAAACALMFAVHPLHIESVAWVSGAADSLTALGILSSLHFWLRNVETPRFGLRVASLFSYAAALLTKETAAVLPAIVFVYAVTEGWQDMTFSKTLLARCKTAFREIDPFLGVTGLYVAARMAVLGGRAVGAGWLGEHNSLFNAPYVIVFYLRHLVWPAGLSFFYDSPFVSSIYSARFLIPVLVLLSIVVCAYLLQRWRPSSLLYVAAAWIFLPLLPVAAPDSVEIGSTIHDRYFYLSCIGAAIAAGQLLKMASSYSCPRSFLLSVASLPAVFFVVLTLLQLRPWRDDVTLYAHAVERSPNSIDARSNLAYSYIRAGKLEEGSQILNGIVRERPDSWEPVYNLGRVSYSLRRTNLAEAFLRRAIVLRPDYPDQYLTLGETYMREGRHTDAVAQFREAIARKSSGWGFHLALGLALMEERDLNGARDEFRDELKFHPNNLGAAFQLGFVEMRLSHSN